MDLKLNNFTNVVANESISQGFGQKEYLGWTDEQIKANREWLRKDASLQYELDQIRGGGPDWAVGSGAAPPPGGGAPGAPPGMPPGEETPPEIGGGAPPAAGADTEVPTPEPTAGGETSALPT